MEKEKEVIKWGLPIQIGLIIGGVLIGKKILEKIGVLKTAEDIEQEKKAAELETGSIGNISQVNVSNPALALNPNYYNTIVDKIKKDKYKGGGIPYNVYLKLVNAGPYEDVKWLDSLSILIKNVYDSKGVFKDDIDKLYSAFQATKNLLQVSLLSKYFYIRYKKDIWEYIKSFTNNEEQSKILNILKNKPLY
jgi:hypothetical protein